MSSLTTAKTPRLFVLIPCAGVGSRALDPAAPSVVPKQYQPIAGQPLVLHTLAAFAGVPRVADVLLVVAPDDSFFEDASAPCVVSHTGGVSRAETVANGLHDLFELGASGDDWVLVHDAARCLVTPAQIDKLIDACWDDPVGGLLALPLPDTLKSEGQGERVGRVDATLPRANKWLAQTPQMFRIGMLSQALQAAAATGMAGITDEASALEAQGLAPKLVAGSAQNFKVTYPEDFALAEAVLESRGRKAELRNKL